MTIEELKKKVIITRRTGGYGYYPYRVETEWNGHTIGCNSDNFIAWERIQSVCVPTNKSVGGYTLRQAYMAFRNECLTKNGII